MKKYFIHKAFVLSLLFTGASLSAQASSTENYISEKTCLDADCIKKAETVSYFDGLGRAKQIVNVKSSPLGKDVVTPVVYDAFGRKTRDYLPLPQTGTQNGQIYSQTPGLAPFPVADATNIYNGEKIYTENVLENSPLDRVKQKVQVGNDWTSHPVNYQYGKNTVSDAVRNFKATTIWENNATKSTPGLLPNYMANKLYKSTTTDEDGFSTFEFTNSQGQVILRRKEISPVEFADTYYVYNEYDDLAFVIPPKAIQEYEESGEDLNDYILSSLCYQYRYDARGNMVEKKLPGTDWQYLVYDKQDRLVATQDGNQRTQNLWSYTKYDDFSRIIMTGLCQGMGNDRLTEQNYVNTKGNNSEYRTTTPAINFSGMDVYYSAHLGYPQADKVYALNSQNFFDTYPVGAPAIPSQILSQNVLLQDAQNSNISTKSLPTASYVKNTEAGDFRWTKTYSYYDTKGRTIGTHSINYLGGYTKTESIVDFTGVVQHTNTYHKRLNTDPEILVKDGFEYDHQNRPIRHWHLVNNNTPELLAENIYNEISQLANKKVGGTIGQPLQDISYAYNIRGWLSKINDPQNLTGKLFGYELKYTDPIYPGYSVPKYNGSITQIDWKTATDGILKRYSYLHDGLNRMVEATYSETMSTTPVNDFFTESVGYDFNGNIRQLSRFAKGINNTPEQIDFLAYNYNGNQLTSVNDDSLNPSGYPGGGNSIDYDANGSMTSHKDQGITSMSYNFLNLPRSVVFDQNNDNLEFTYRADGVKLQKVYQYYASKSGLTVTEKTDYLDGFQYEETGGINTLQFFPTSEGYYDFQKARYVYNYEDHLGDVRLAYYKGSNNLPVIDRETNYYPFGLEFEGYSGSNTQLESYRYGYNGKERQKETGFVDYGWRQYMPNLGRWMQYDPLVEDTEDPYAYVHNSPIKLGDPDGRAPEECCQKVKGFLLTVTDNALGTNLRNKYAVNSQAYRDGVNSGHGASIAVSALLVADGGGNITGGTAGLVASGTAASTGVGSAPGAAGATLSGIAIIKGTAEVAMGVNMFSNTAKNVKSDVSKSSSNSDKKPYSKSRPSYARGQVDKVWNSAKQKDGKVYDPNTKEELTWDKTKKPRQWDMGHKPGHEYRTLHKKYMKGKISKAEFLKQYKDPNNYQPESKSANRSHKYEKK